MTTYDLIREAIEQKKQVVADYKGYRREMCPHALGTKNGRVQALFYQCGGESSSGVIVPGSPGNWRCMPIDQLHIFEVRDGEWSTASNHSRPQSCIDDVHFEVEY